MKNKNIFIIDPQQDVLQESPVLHRASFIRPRKKQCVTALPFTERRAVAASAARFISARQTSAAVQVQLQTWNKVTLNRSNSPDEGLTSDPSSRPRFLIRTESM